ncbi:MAG: hypothetical protein JW395_3978 [Nitrospira sp.]|nr:hypothetical protein [Nitrospira sp.]
MRIKSRIAFSTRVCGSKSRMPSPVTSSSWARIEASGSRTSVARNMLNSPIAACRSCFLMMGSEGLGADVAPGAPASPAAGAWPVGAGAWRMSAIFTIVGSSVRASVCW